MLHQRGIEAAKKAGVYQGRKKMLTTGQVNALRQCAEKGESKASLAEAVGISREMAYQSLKAVNDA